MPALQFAFAVLPVVLLSALYALKLRNAAVSAFLLGALPGLTLAGVHGTALLDARIEPACTSQPVAISGVVDSLPVANTTHRADLRQSITLAVTEVQPQQCGGLRTVHLAYFGDEVLLPGQQWKFMARLKLPWGRANPGSSSFQAWFAQQGVDAVGSASTGELIAQSSENRARNAPVHVQRHRISQAITALDLAPQVVAVLRAVTVADKGGVSNQLWRLFRDLGVSHLLVISGLHVGLVGGLGVLLGSAAARLFHSSGMWVRWMPAIFGIVPAAAYSALAGFSLPTQRASIMLSVFLLCTAIGRPVSAELRLLWAALFVLAVNPLAAIGSGFWLSFGAVLALLWFTRWQRPQVPLWRRLVRTHVFMSLAMLPLSAWFFGGASTVAALANFVFIPLIGFVVVPLALLGALAYLLHWPAYETLWAWAALPLQGLLPVAQALVEVAPHSVFLPANVSLVATVTGAVGVMLLVLPGAALSRCFGCLLLCPLLVGSVTEQPSDTGTMRIAALDVGQGTAVVVIAGDRALVYDSGGGDPAGRNAATEVVIPYLKHRGVNALDTLVISHGDLDHSAGLRALLDAFDVRRIRYGSGVDPAVVGRGCRAGESWRWPDGPQFRFLSPATFSGLSTNNGSCVLQIALGDYRILLSGDIDKRREREIAVYWRHALRTDWLLVAHHGSGTSSSHVMLKAAEPDIAVFSAAYMNAFGHPREDVVSRLEQYGALLLNTAESGALEFDVNSTGLAHLSSFRNAWLPYWMQ